MWRFLGTLLIAGRSVYGTTLQGLHLAICIKVKNCTHSMTQKFHFKKLPEGNQDYIQKLSCKNFPHSSWYMSMKGNNLNIWRKGLLTVLWSTIK